MRGERGERMWAGGKNGLIIDHHVQVVVLNNVESFLECFALFFLPKARVQGLYLGDDDGANVLTTRVQ